MPNLRFRSLIAFLLGAILFVSGCGAKSPSADGSAGSDQSDSASDTLKVGLAGNPSDTFNAGNGTTALPYVTAWHLFGQLVRSTANGPELMLAESIEPNEDATVWTVKLRDDIKFHDGSPVTSEDALASLKNASESNNFMAGLQVVDFEASKAIDDATFEIHLKSPRADFVEAELVQHGLMYKGGDPESKIGAGPYKYVSGDFSTGIRLEANEDWFEGKPATQYLELLSIPEATARAEALQAGEIDYAHHIDPTSTEQLKDVAGIEILDGGAVTGQGLMFVLNTRVAPFDDPELRKAMKLAVDRQQMVDVLLGEYGVVGYDATGLGHAGYDDSLDNQNPDTAKNKEAAKKIFEEKGLTEFTLYTFEFTPGLTASAELLQQQLAELGVTVNLVAEDPSGIWSDMDKLYSMQAFTFYAGNRAHPINYAMMVGKDAGFNVSGYTSDVVEENLALSRSELDPKDREVALATVQRDLQENGAELIWGYQASLSAAKDNVSGVEYTTEQPWFYKAELK